MPSSALDFTYRYTLALTAVGDKMYYDDPTHSILNDEWIPASIGSSNSVVIGDAVRAQP